MIQATAGSQFKVLKCNFDQSKLSTTHRMFPPWTRKIGCVTQSTQQQPHLLQLQCILRNCRVKKRFLCTTVKKGKWMNFWIKLRKMRRNVAPDPLNQSFDLHLKWENEFVMERGISKFQQLNQFVIKLLTKLRQQTGNPTKSDELVCYPKGDAQNFIQNLHNQLTVQVCPNSSMMIKLARAHTQWKKVKLISSVNMEKIYLVR